MDKAEYRVMLDRINELYDTGNYTEALPIVEGIDWRRVKSVRTLCMVSEIYEKCERLEDCYKILKIAYKRASISKQVLYRLAETSAKLGNFKEAVTYYREFDEISPMDSSKYILKYEIYRAKGAPIEEQIKILETYKEREYTEQWAYELAELYSEAGMKDACVNACDDLILWFSEGTYVKKAMELKKKYASLTMSQKKKYQEMSLQKTAELPKWEIPTIDLESKILANTEVVIPKPEETEEMKEIPPYASTEPAVQMDPSRMQNQLADSIRAVFSGINKVPEDFSESEEEDKIYKPSVSDMTGYEIKELEPERVDETENKDEPEAIKINSEEEDGQIAGQLSFTDLEQPQEIDLEALIAETSSSLAQEVASGDFEMTDEPVIAEEEVIRKVAEKVARKTEEEAIVDEKETDESLGLTREFNFNEELKKSVEEFNPTVTETEDEDIAEALAAAVTAISGELNQEDYPPFKEDEKTEEITIDKVELEDLEKLFQESVQEPKQEFVREEKRLEYVPVEPRELSEKEKKIFSYFVKIPGMSQQITETISDVHNNAGDKTSKKGNFLIIGRQGSGKTKLFENMVLAICNDLGIEAAKMARIIGRDLNKKDSAAVVSKLSGGFLVIEGAGELSDETVENLSRAMEFRTDSLVVALEDEKADLYAMLERHPEFAEKFTTSIKIPVFTNDELVSFAKTYASESGYKMDEMGILALYTKIGDNQKDSEPVTVGKVKDIMDDAINHANKGTRKIGRKFSKNGVDEENRVLLLEKDFE